MCLCKIGLKLSELKSKISKSEKVKGLSKDLTFKYGKDFVYWCFLCRGGKRRNLSFKILFCFFLFFKIMAEINNDMLPSMSVDKPS